MVQQAKQGLGSIISGQQLAQPSGPPSSEMVAEENLRFLERPEVQVGLLQLGISLLSPGDLGSAFADAAGAAGRYTQNQRQQGIEDRQLEQQETQHRATIANRFASTDALRGQATESQARASNIPVVNAARTRELGQGDRRLGLQEQGLTLEQQRLENDRRRLELLEQQYRAQAASAGLVFDELDKAIFNQTADLMRAEMDAQSNLAGLSGDTGALQSFDPVQFSIKHNQMRQLSGKPPLDPFGDGASTQPLQSPQSTDAQSVGYILDAPTVRQAKAEGATRDQLKALLQRFNATPEAVEEIMRDNSR